MGSDPADDPEASALSAFIDASVLVPAAISSRGSARDLIDAGIQGLVMLVVSQDVLDEAERNLRRKAPHAFGTFWAQRDRLMRVDPTADLVKDISQYIEPKDAHVVAGAIAAGVPYLVSYDRRHLLGESDLIRQRWTIEVVTPNVLVALVASQ